MRRSIGLRVQQAFWQSLVALLVFSVAGCAQPTPVQWNPQLPVDTPQVSQPKPQGTLVVYSERYVIEDSGVPYIYRRRVEAYTAQGQYVGNYRNPMGDAPVRIALSPGRYVVLSQSDMQWREIQVDIEDGQETVITEDQLTHAALLSAATAELRKQRTSP